MAISDSSGSLLAYVGFEFLDRVRSVLRNACMRDFNTLAESILSSPRVFFCGAGRSGLVGRFFAMRLMHLGCMVYIVGETTTTAIRREDLLVAISGSGKTQTVLDIVNMAKKAGAKVAAISLDIGNQSPLDKLVDISVKIDRREGVGDRLENPFPADLLEKRTARMPLGTVFEISALIYLEALISEIIKRGHVSESEMKQRHANLE